MEEPQSPVMLQTMRCSQEVTATEIKSSKHFHGRLANFRPAVLTEFTNACQVNAQVV